MCNKDDQKPNESLLCTIDGAMHHYYHRFHHFQYDNVDGMSRQFVLPTEMQFYVFSSETIIAVV